MKSTRQIVRHTLASLFLMMAALPSLAEAAGLSFNRADGSRSGFQVNVAGDNATATINADYVCNPTSGAQNVFLLIWYTTQAGPAGNGFVGGTLSLGSLPANNCFTGIARSVSHSAPPNGSYNVHLLAKATSGGSDVYDDAITGSTKFTFDTGGGGGTGGGDSGGGTGGGSGGGTGVLSLTDANGTRAGSIAINNGTYGVAVGGICNRTQTARNVVIQLWYTTQASPEGNGFTGATLTLGTLNSGSCFNNFSDGGSHNNPPTGSYFGHILLLESASGKFVDSLTMTDKFSFSAPPPTSTGDALLDAASAAGSWSFASFVLGAVVMMLRHRRVVYRR